MTNQVPDWSTWRWDNSGWTIRGLVNSPTFGGNHCV